MLVSRIPMGLPIACLVAMALHAPAAGQPSTVERAPIAAIATAQSPNQAKGAVLYSLKLRLPAGQGLARMLIQAGVSQSDAAAAARLAAGHLGAENGGCDAKIEISRALEEDSYRLERAVLLTASDQTVIERRAGELIIASRQTKTVTARII